MARAPRRSFSAPFVITLAAGCTVQTAAPPPQQPTVAEPAPQPAPEPAQPAQPAQPPGDGTVVVANPPRPQPTTAPAAQRDTYWNVWKDGAECRAVQRVECPTPEPGKPAITCNPPPPFAYACPAGWDGTSSLVVVQYQGSTECLIPGKAPACAPNEKCKPAPSQKVPCPTR